MNNACQLVCAAIDRFNGTSKPAEVKRQKAHHLLKSLLVRSVYFDQIQWQTSLNDRFGTDCSMKTALNSNAYLPAFHHSKKNILKQKRNKHISVKKTAVQFSMSQELSLL